MKSKLMLLTLALAATTTAFAQSTREKYSSNGGDNIFVSVTGGISTVNSGPKEGGLGDVAPHVTVSVGKWFNPVLGLRLQAGAWTANYDTKHSYGTLTSDGIQQPNPVKYDKGVVIGRFDVLYNLSNAIFGYNPDRIFTLSAFAGPGLTFAKNINGAVEENYANNTYKRYGTNDKLKALVNGSAGLLGKFAVNDYLDIDLEARAELASSYLGYNSTAKQVGGLYFGAGVTYTFGGKRFVPVNQKVDTGALNDEINRLRSDLAKAQSDLSDARNALANAKPEVREVEKLVEVAAPQAVFFTLGSARIDDYNGVHVKNAAAAMKKNSDIKYVINGYADKATGSANYNETLSQKRAQAVYDALIAEGVSSSQIEISAKGGVDNMFGKNKLQRVVIIEKR